MLYSRSMLTQTDMMDALLHWTFRIVVLVCLQEHYTPPPLLCPPVRHVTLPHEDRTQTFSIRRLHLTQGNPNNHYVASEWALTMCMFHGTMIPWCRKKRNRPKKKFLKRKDGLTWVDTLLWLHSDTPRGVQFTVQPVFTQLWRMQEKYCDDLPTVKSCFYQPVYSSILDLNLLSSFFSLFFFLFVFFSLFFPFCISFRCYLEHIVYDSGDQKLNLVHDVGDFVDMTWLFGVRI